MQDVPAWCIMEENATFVPTTYTRTVYDMHLLIYEDVNKK